MSLAATTNIYLPVAAGSIYYNGAINNLDLIAGGSIHADLQFASFDSAADSSIVLDLSFYSLPAFGNSVSVYGYDYAAGQLTSSDYNAGTYLGSLVIPGNIIYETQLFFDVTSFVQSEQGAYFGFELQSSEVDWFNIARNVYDPPPELIATSVPEPSICALTAFGGLLLGGGF